MRAPPESDSPMIGQRQCSARSMTFTIFAACASPKLPPKTVKSWLNTQKKNTNNKAKILITTFEDYLPKNNLFDLCLFAESFQYIPIKIALRKASSLLNNDGEILIADCFRSEKKQEGILRQPGGGASLISMEKELRIQKINVIVKKEITKLVAPSIQLEQKFYNTLGFSIKRIIASLKINRPFTLKFLKSFKVKKWMLGVSYQE